MASPLILRITSTYDNRGTTEAAKAHQDLAASVTRAGQTARSSTGDFEQMTATLAGVRIVSDKAKVSFGDTFSSFAKSLRSVRGVLRLFRTALFVQAFVLAPLTAFIKKTEETEKALLPVITRLNQLGQAGEFQATRLRNFAENLQRTTGQGTLETIQSLNLLVSKTRTVADAEQIINTAQKIRLGTGQKLIDVTKALAEAQTGNAATLAAMTGRTEQEINALAQSGKLIETLDASFEEAAQRGLASFSTQFGILVKKVGQGTYDMVKAITTLRTNVTAPVAVFLKLSDAVNAPKKQLEELEKLLGKTFEKKTPIDLRSFESLQIAAGQAADEVERLKKALAVGTKLSTTQKKDLEDILEVRQKELSLLQAMAREEAVIASAQREMLSARTLELELQEKLQKLGEEGAGSERVKKDIEARKQQTRDELVEAQRKIILLEAQEEARSIFITKKREADAVELTNIEARANAKYMQLRLATFKQDQQIANAKLSTLRALKQAQVDLQSFELKTSQNRFQDVSSEDRLDEQDKLDKKRIQLAVLNAQQERDAILAERQLTSEDAERIEAELQTKISEIREGMAQRRADREIELSKLSLSQRKKLEEDEQKNRDLVDSFRTGGRKTETQFNFEQDTNKLVEKTRADLSNSTEAAKLKEDLKNLLTPQQLGLKKLMEDWDKEVRGKEIAVKITFFEDKAKTLELAENLGVLISGAFLRTLLKNITPLGSALQAIQGAPQGGRE